MAHEEARGGASFTAPPRKAKRRRGGRPILLLCFIAGGGCPTTTGSSAPAHEPPPPTTTTTADATLGRAATTTTPTKQIVPLPLRHLAATNRGRRRLLTTDDGTTTTITTFSELVAAVGNGVTRVDVAVDTVTFANVVQVANGDSVEITTSATSATLDGGGAVRLFRVNGELTLRALRLAYGAVSTSECDVPYAACGGGAMYVGAAGSLVLVNCVVEHSEAYVRCARARVPEPTNRARRNPMRAASCRPPSLARAVCAVVCAAWLRLHFHIVLGILIAPHRAAASPRAADRRSFGGGALAQRGGAILVSGGSAAVVGSSFTANRAQYIVHAHCACLLSAVTRLTDRKRANAAMESALRPVAPNLARLFFIPYRLLVRAGHAAARAQGGVLNLRDGASATIESSTFTDNSAQYVPARR